MPVRQSAPPAMMAPVAVRAWTATTALGIGVQAQLQGLLDGRSGLRPNDFGPRVDDAPLPCWIGRVDGIEESPLPAALAHWECRNNRLAWMALQADGLPTAIADTVSRHGRDRVAVVVGTSTSAIGATEEAYTRLQPDGEGAHAFPPDLARPLIHTVHALGGFIQEATGLAGPCVTVATACSSSAKVFAQAARLLHAGIADAVLVGGVDTLCGSVLYGFNSLQLVSRDPCRPFAADRDGLSLGEAGGFALLERASRDDSDLKLCGYGESSDAHHMSHPHPEGEGARLAMRDALARAGIEAAQVDYLNLHGTATPANDRVESIAVGVTFPSALHASSTKGWTGHTLGAAGIVESVFALLALREELLPGTLGADALDPTSGPQVQVATERAPVAYAMSNSFGFGGNNCSLVFGR